MEKSLAESLLRVCKAFNACSVEYLIVGGTAVALHGYYRRSYDPSGKVIEKHDLDFWYNPTYNNYYRVLNALELLGLDVTDLKNETTPNPKKSFLRFEQNDFKLDLLPEIQGLSKFRISYDKGIISNIQGEEARCLNLDDLVLSKEVIGRKQDIEDIHRLKSRNTDPE